MTNDEILKENRGKKYDIVLMNPPYDNGLYKKFLIKILDISDKSVTIHPVDFILGKKPNKNILDKINDGFDLQLVNSMSDFDAGILGTLGILNHNSNGKLVYNGNEFDSVNDIKPWSDDLYLDEFYNIIKNLIDNDSLDKHIKEKEQPWSGRYTEKNPKNSWWCIKISQLRGNQSKSGVMDDYYTFIPRDRISQTYKELEEQRNTNNLCYFAFDKRDDCNNFINYLKSDFARTALRLIKTTGNLMRGELKFIPWFDFSDNHFSKTPKEIDDYLFKKYNISDEIRKHIEEILPDYYHIRD